MSRGSDDSREKCAVVITTINPPTKGLDIIYCRCAQQGWRLVIVGDKKTPEAEFDQMGEAFLGMSAQANMNFPLATKCKENHYSRKNLGYLFAAQHGASVIIETDDDNIPTEEFFRPRARELEAAVVANGGWVNVYRHFSDANIWPRGYPLEYIKDNGALVPDRVDKVNAIIQQGLADNDPDVDAVFRLTQKLPHNFRKNVPLCLKGNSTCPFNSQNTTWFREAFPLLYLPSFCSFRMVDIWRSFVAIRILSEGTNNIAFHNATVWQERNIHDLLMDFEDEIDGYLHNKRIMKSLFSLDLGGTDAKYSTALRHCYERLVSIGIFPEKELELLDLWIESCDMISKLK